MPIAPPEAAIGTSVVHAADYLPAGFPHDASVDATRYLQVALENAVGGRLVLPAYPLLVSAPPGRQWCLRIPGPLELVGTPGSALVERAGAVQVLRAEQVDGLTLRDFAVRGLHTPGHSLAHGLVQVTFGSDVRISNLSIDGSDADGIAIAGARNVTVDGCVVRGAAKSGIYVSDCDGGAVTANTVEGFGGHIAPDGSVNGAGIQLSSNTDVSCRDNLIRSGTGMGILCNAGRDSSQPLMTTITGNRIHDVANEANRAASSGIHCANSSADKLTNTLIAGNLIQHCGLHGIYLSMHSGSHVFGNTVTESERSGIVVSACEDVELRDNLVRNSDVSAFGGQASIYLLNASRGVHVAGNRLVNSNVYAEAHGFTGVIDTCEPGANDIPAEDCVE